MWKTYLAVALVVGACEASNGSRYTFYRELGASGGKWRSGGGGGGGGSGRRVFGGAAAALSAWPAACALLDRWLAARCSAAALAPRWALTAAHCVSPRLAYLKYNTRRPAAPEGDLTPILFLYRHPKYRVVQQDEGRGVDVTLLHHDVGLVRTRDLIHLAAAPPTLRSPHLPRSPHSRDPLTAMRLYNLADLQNEEVEVLGFGRTERSVLGEELFGVRLRVVACERGEWRHCACGAPAPPAADPRGVCSGDSGGPVIYKGVQVGVTSMGPTECAHGGSGVGGMTSPATGATSVFTALFHYADVINATIEDTEAALRMRMINCAPHAPHAATLAQAPLLLMLLLLPACNDS